MLHTYKYMAKMGRPLKFSSVEELQNKIDDFFNTTPQDEQTITGLAIHLDTTRDLLCDYEDLEQFSDAIKRAKQRIRNEYEKRAIKRGNAGDIFALKNFGWTDKQVIDTNIKGELSLTDMLNKDKKGK